MNEVEPRLVGPRGQGVGRREKKHPLVFTKLFQERKMFLKPIPPVLDRLGKEFKKLMPPFLARRKVKIKNY